MTRTIRRRLAVFGVLALASTAVAVGAGAAPVVFSTTPIAGWSTNAPVRAVLIVGDTVYAGGDFTTVRGPGGTPTATRAHLAAWDIHTGALRTGFTADTNGRVESLASDGTRLFVGGDFTTIKGVSKSRLAALDPATGNVINGWTANASSHVYALHVTGPRLYVGGSFGTLAGAARGRVGAVATATGAIDASFNPNVNDAVHGIAVSPDGATVYLGGDFTTVGGTARGFLAPVSSTTGALLPLTFQYPFSGSTLHGMDGLDISPSGDRLFGALTGNENRVEAWSTTTGQVQWYYQVDGDVQAVRYYQGNVYFGFHEGAIGDHTVRMLVADATTGQLENSYRPPIDSFYGIWAIDISADALVLGGEFTNISGVATQGVAILPPQAVDPIAPTAPGTPTVTNALATSVSLAWTPGTDNMGVAGYRVLRDGVEVGYSTTTTFTDSGVAPDTTYSYTVQTVDTAGNTSPSSGAVSTRTGSVLVAAGSVWKYLDDGSNQGTAWRSTGYADGAWASGPAELGYGDGDEATVVGYGPDANNRYITTYFRRSFPVTDPASISALTLGLVRDDGAVVYVNGTEVARSDMPTGTITSATRALTAVGGAEESQWFTFPVAPSVLVAGTNTVAVEIHQNNATSSDISFNLSLEAVHAPVGSAPTGLTVSGVTDTTASLQWTAPAGSGTTTGYRVYRDGSLVGSPSGTTFTDTGLASGHTYTYTVSAITNGQETAATAPVDATTTTTNPPPGNLHITGVTDTTVALAWDAPTGAGVTTGYRIYRGGSLMGSPTATSFTDTGVPAGRTYTYSVSAITNGVETATVAVNATTTDTVGPTPPTGLAAPTVAADHVVLTWTASTDNVGVTGYDVLRDGAVVGTTATATYTDATVTTNASYSYAVRARDAAGNLSLPSTPLAVTTPSFVGKTYEDNFDSGTFTTARWTTAGAAIVAGTTPGTFFARLTAASSAAAYLTWPTSVLEQGHRDWSLRASVRVGSHNSNQSVSLVELKTVAGRSVYVYTNATTGRCTLSFAGVSATTTFRCEDGAWHLLELKGDFSTTTTVDWRVDGVAQATVTATGQTATTARNLYLGEPASGPTNVQDWDGVKLVLGDAALPFPGGTNPIG
ncbi:MAG: fibronectin type III domain-containing protein [Acidimicrobiia bacterium]